MPFERDILINLLHNMGSRREIDQYLRLFTGVDSMRFAVIKIGGGVMEDALEELASALAFLRKVGLFPIIVHGGGPQLNRELESRHIASTFVDGFRVTTPEVLAVARRVFQAEGTKLAAALEAQGVRARPISSGVFTATPMDPARLGLVGDVTHVDLTMIEDTIRAGQLPILASLGETESGQILNVNADVVARELALAVRPTKIIFITPTGGLLDESGRIIPAINLAEDYERLATAPWVYGGFARKLAEIKQLLDQLPEWSSVSITSPEHLARELFTHRGMGTLVRRGVPIRVIRDAAEIDEPRLTTLIENSFGRRLKPGYLHDARPDLALIAGDYAACAIVRPGPSCPYLDKFAVSAEGQGAGLGASLWNRLAGECPRLLWRSRADNPIRNWYFALADGMHRGRDWIVFWTGLHERSEIADGIDFALAEPPSFQSPVVTREEVTLVS